VRYELIICATMNSCIVLKGSGSHCPQVAAMGKVQNGANETKLS